MIEFPGLLWGMLQLVAMRNILTTRLPGFLDGHTLSTPMEDGSPLGHEDRATGTPGEIVRGTLVFNLEMLVIDQTVAVFQTLVL